MLTEFDYVVAWAIYLLCAVGLYWALTRLVKFLRFPVLIYFFKSIIAVILFTPGISVPDQNLWAPATIVAVYGYIQDEQLLATQAALFILGAWCVVGLLLFLNYLFSLIRVRGRDRDTEKDTESETTTSFKEISDNKLAPTDTLNTPVKFHP